MTLRLTWLAAPLLILAIGASAQEQFASAENLRQLSIEELSKIRVTSVSKSEEPLNSAAATIFVITRDMIRRSGAATIPEILRLAPNLHVARLDANGYAISARGFNQSSGTANKLLVLIDGRAIYSPLFSGTFWDAQRTFIDDIDRIEVISGTGGTLWGANAVNGVINIITKDSITTRGWNVDVRLGTLDRRIAARGGASLGLHGSIRGYVLGSREGSMVRANGDDTGDSWNRAQAGMRADWRSNNDTFTLQGDTYRGTGIGEPAFLPSGSTNGSNISLTWQRDMRSGSGLRVQGYYDTTRRVLVSGIDASVDQYSLETQCTLARHARHAIVLGGGVRVTEDDFERGPNTAFLSPASRRLTFANAFAQDSITLTEQLRLIGGAKIEHNTYTGFELMPDVRFAWTPTSSANLWIGVSRAVRTPSRFDTELINRGILLGNADFHSEELLAYEAGYRGLITTNLSVTASLFYDSYDELRSIESAGATLFPLIVRNNMKGNTRGVEAWADYSVVDSWRVHAGVRTLQKNLRFEPGTRDFFGTGFAGNDPRIEWSLRSEHDLPRGVTADVWLRHSGRLDDPAVESYTEADARVSWPATDALTLSLDGQNLLHEQHLEFVNPAIGPRFVPRSFTIAARWTR
jgi:iron complex outermembrane receptor protein